MSYTTDKHTCPRAKLLLSLVVCGLISACGTTSPTLKSGITADQPVQAAQQNAHQGNFARAADLFALAARRQTEADKQSALHLQATLAALKAQQPNLAQRELAATVPAQLNQADQRRYAVAQKLVQLAPLPTAQQLEQLPPPPGNTPPPVAALIWQVRAGLLFDQYRYIAGIHSLVQRSAWLGDKQAIRHNNERIFNRALEAIKLGRGTDNPAAGQTDPTTRGWLRLAEIKTYGPPKGQALQKALKQWEHRFTGHPATRGVLADVFDYQPFSTTPLHVRKRTTLAPGPILLALPLSGKLAVPGQAIRAGFKMAHNHGAETRRIITADTASMTAGKIIQQARRENAALIVGPLTKHKVAALAQLAPRIPVLALNQVDNVSMPPSFYRFALAPEDDARTAAKHAAALGWRNALVLVPQGDWGGRILTTFRDSFARHGGTIVDYATFETQQYNHKQAVQSVLQSYHQGASVDFVFIAARPVHARLLRSQLRFYHAAKLPVIATSDAYGGHPAPRKNADLNGIFFTATPWAVSPSPRIHRARAQALELGTQATRRFPRLFAMGIDAWRLSHRWAVDELAPGTTLTGTTGRLEIMQSGRVRRHLSWAHFVDGYAVLVNPADSDDSSQSDTGAVAPQSQSATMTSPATLPSHKTKTKTKTSDRQGSAHDGSAATDVSPIIDMSGSNAAIPSEHQTDRKTGTNHGSVYPVSPSHNANSLLY